jgi:hypothetical protein
MEAERELALKLAHEEARHIGVDAVLANAERYRRFLAGEREPQSKETAP